MFVDSDQVKVKKLEEKISRKILGYGGSLMMVEVIFKKDGIGEIHSHVHEQVSYIVKGSFEVTIGNEKKILKQGDSFYAPSSTPHGVVALEDSVILDVFTPIRREFL
ncbi:MAG: cupin domain-containing protein [Clostridia bacterium]|nr:cupin domain-containing protein [Clostridia bacterium]